jgi:hypothetical protein
MMVTASRDRTQKYNKRIDSGQALRQINRASAVKSSQGWYRFAATNERINSLPHSLPQLIITTQLTEGDDNYLEYHRLAIN